MIKYCIKEVENKSVKSLGWSCLTCTALLDTVSGIKEPWEGSVAVTSSGHPDPVKQHFQDPAVQLRLMSGYLPAMHSCLSRFQCSAMQKINFSGKTTSRQVNLITVSNSTISLSTLFSPLDTHTQTRSDLMRPGDPIKSTRGFAIEGSLAWEAAQLSHCLRWHLSSRRVRC